METNRKEKGHEGLWSGADMPPGVPPRIQGLVRRVSARGPDGEGQQCSVPASICHAGMGESFWKLSPQPEKGGGSH